MNHKNRATVSPEPIFSSERADERLARDTSHEVRQERESQERELTQEHELTDSQRLDALRMEYFQQSLPNLPKIPGFHVCWLSTQSSRDPIYGRIRLGYTPIRLEEVPGFEHASLKTGEYSGCVGVNEMVAFKLPDRLYLKYMTELHHTEPARQEEMLGEASRVAQDAAKGVNKNTRFDVEEGTAELGRGALQGRFE